MIGEHHLRETVKSKLIVLVGEDKAESLFFRDVVTVQLDPPSFNGQRGLTLIFDRYECIYIANTDGSATGEIAHIHSLILGKKTWRDRLGKKRLVRSTPAWDTYRQASNFNPTRGYFSWLSWGHYSAYFIPIHFAVDRTFWRAALIQALSPCCNDEVDQDNVIRQELLKLAPHDCSEEQQVTAVRTDPLTIEVIENPCEQAQIAAVESYSYAIADLVLRGITPSRNVIMAAARSNGHAIEFLDFDLLDEEILLAAVRSRPYVIARIDAPSSSLQLEAVCADPTLIRFIDDPTEETQLAAISQDAALYFEIRAPCEEAVIAYIKATPYIIESLPPLSIEVNIRILMEEPSAIVPLVLKGLIDQPIGSKELREPIVRALLTELKEDGSNDTLLIVVERLKEIGYDWPELDIMEKSLRADLR